MGAAREGTGLEMKKDPSWPSLLLPHPQVSGALGRPLDVR